MPVMACGTTPSNGVPLTFNRDLLCEYNHFRSFLDPHFFTSDIILNPTPLPHNFFL